MLFTFILMVLSCFLIKYIKKKKGKERKLYLVQINSFIHYIRVKEENVQPS
jgi:hypothetical protein